MLRCIRAMKAAKGAARVLSVVWLPGLTSGMKFSTADFTRASRFSNFPWWVERVCCASFRSAAASAPNRYS